ncbi:MAG TPA: hypothetical protein VLG50_03150 [Candidatus Saccharimonadales bacterium]|nr:hypothetical protein [Candidatus Saccharimonadales bacterium]
MMFLKKVILGACIAVALTSCMQTTQRIYNFRWHLMNVLQQHCQDVSGSTKKIGSKNPCLISFDPLIQTPLLNKVLVEDTLVKKKVFLPMCTQHMTNRKGTSKLSQYDAVNYCKRAYGHFKQAHHRYERSPKLGYVSK